MNVMFVGGPLFDGDIEDYKGSPHVMCPWHGYMFDVKTGANEIGLMVIKIEATHWGDEM